MVRCRSFKEMTPLYTLLNMSQQALAESFPATGPTKHLLAHDRQRASDGSPVAICTTPIRRLIRFGWNKTQLVDPKW